VRLSVKKRKIDVWYKANKSYFIFHLINTPPIGEARSPRRTEMHTHTRTPVAFLSSPLHLFLSTFISHPMPQFFF
jgi:hypothetical protein